MTEREMIEIEKHWCENCCNWDKEKIQMDGYSECKLTGTSVFVQEYGGNCKCFNIPAENIIAPPCKVGDTVYIIKRCRCGLPENYDLKACGRKVTERTPKVLARVFFQEKGKRLKPTFTGKLEYEIVPKGTVCYSVYEKQFTLKMLAEIGKTVFLTKEEAKAALCKLQASNQHVRKEEVYNDR